MGNKHELEEFETQDGVDVAVKYGDRNTAQTAGEPSQGRSGRRQCDDVVIEYIVEIAPSDILRKLLCTHDMPEHRKDMVRLELDRRVRERKEKRRRWNFRLRVATTIGVIAAAALTFAQ